ncbi:MAG TPA: PqqD family protein [Rhodothermales bacterium]|nr:PqqD family protein [Rhodothermales bacterium]
MATPPLLPNAVEASSGVPETPIDREIVPRRHPAVDAHPVGDEMVLYHSETELALSLNVSARTIWELCDGKRSVAEICTTLKRDTGGAAESTLHADVLSTVRALREFGALSLANIPDVAS